jgi:hypothetical protein
MQSTIRERHTEAVEPAADAGPAAGEDHPTAINHQRPGAQRVGDPRDHGFRKPFPMLRML